MRPGTIDVSIEGIIKSSLVANLIRSNTIWSQPFRPAIDGPKRRCA